MADILYFFFFFMEGDSASKRLYFITKDNSFLVYSVFQYIIWYTLFFYINIYQPFGTEASSVAHCLKCDACQRNPDSHIRGVVSGESPGYFSVFPKGF